MSGTSLMETLVLCLPVSEQVLSYTCSGVPRPFTVPRILIDNMLIGVGLVVAEVLFCCEVQRQVKQQITEYVALTFPSESTPVSVIS